MEHYSLPKRELMQQLETQDSGLSREEAAARLQKYGKNQLQAGKKSSLIRLFFAQFKDLMTAILVCAAVLSAVLAYITRDVSELADTAILLFIIVLNAVVGCLQQYRADRAIEKLKKLSTATAKVVRGGRLKEIDASELVVGDIVEIEEGDRIPADCRILESEELKCDESSLTGESKAVKKYDCVVKKQTLSERANTVHFSTFCVSGRARCVVVKTGMETEMGAIANLLNQSAPVPSPLDKLIVKLGKIISWTVLTVAAILFLVGMLSGRVGLLDNFMAAIAVAVAAIPEGMGAVVTVILAMGVQRMSGFYAVMRKLSAVETLGSCTCICSDKTGTLTRNKMTVGAIATDCTTDHERYLGTPWQQRLLLCMRICETVKGNAGAYVGDPTEVALVEYADGCNFSARFRILSGGIPFSSERKRMSVRAETGEGSRLFVKGGADVLLPQCKRLYDGTPMTESARKKIEERISEFASSAMRVLAFAEGDSETSLTFLGIVALYDPPKEGAKEAVASCRRAGVKTVMITGDSAETAFAIAKTLGIATDPSEVLTGDEIDALGESFARNVKRYHVYARVSPKHKLQIVQALQSQGEIVAMTGDGVNDAPSVKTADIGVAMGSGTDVTKNAADMVIADDDFSTMVHAVEEGRGVFYNVKRTISFFLSTNLAEVFAVLIATLFLWRFDFLTSTQLLWINLITDSLPVLALGVERTVGTMERPPVSINEIFSKKSLLSIGFFGAVQTTIVVGTFVFALNVWGNGVASTCAFLVLSLLELLHVFNVRKEDGGNSLFNRTLLVTVSIGVVVTVLLVAVAPLAAIFDLTALNPVQWILVFAVSLFVIPVGYAYRGGVRLIDGRIKMRKKRILAHGNIR